jgi:asparagine synthase (glutamine-hydrolysing)
MCGIAGIVGPGAERHREALSRMVAALRHRGPDGEGTHFFPGCALGHTRLSIVDLATGDQPMLGPGDETAIVLNGEIYGYRELRESLADYPFKTTSDTEVVLMLYLKFREKMPEALPGMFAFALWDEQRQRLLAARDRFGEKPFFYARGPDAEFIFASEIRAILASGLVTPRLSRESVAHFLRRRFVHPHRTIYENVHTLPPAHALTLTDGAVEVRRYWNLPPPVRESVGVDNAADWLRRFFSSTVKRQLVADVPVGAFLSGGLDSSTVVAAASAHRKGIRTISFGFRGEMDERPYAREVAAKFGTDHVEVDEIDLPVAAMMRRMAEVYDEPFADSSAIATYAVCAEARKHLKVVLTGDGADELLAGYDWWYAPLLDMEREPRHSDFRRLVLRIAAAALRRTGRFDGPARRLRGIDLRGEHGTVGVAHSRLREFFSDAELAALDLPIPPREEGGDSLDAALRADLATYLPGEILLKADRASMAHGLELRAPFLDAAVAEFLAALPSSLKLSGTESKIVLRRAFSRDWPESIRRRGKQGFGAPVDRWLLRDDVQELVARCFDDPGSRLNTLLPREAVAAFRDEGRHRTWALLTLGLWLDSVGP